jgi:hypothetical protein
LDLDVIRDGRHRPTKAEAQAMADEIERLRAENAQLWHQQPREPFSMEEPPAKGSGC